ncbi:hypothetical protein P7C73_g4213, partial [Tremellales sp. Uapishka_1]
MGSASRTVFGKWFWFANIPYDVSEEQLASVFSEVGPVSGVEIKFDPLNGRSKGYAFVQYYGERSGVPSLVIPPNTLWFLADEATALSAVRNLQEVPVNGRNLRVESSTDEPGPRRGQGGGGPPERVGGGGG